MVCALAAATALTRSSCLSGSSALRIAPFAHRLVDEHDRTCEAFASAAAAAGSVPSLYSTLAPSALARYTSAGRGKYCEPPVRHPGPRLALRAGGAAALPPADSPAPIRRGWHTTSACDPITRST